MPLDFPRRAHHMDGLIRFIPQLLYTSQAPDPCKGLSDRARVGLEKIIRLFDDITDLFIDSYVTGQSILYYNSLQTGTQTTPLPVHNEKIAGIRATLIETYPRLQDRTDMTTLSAHIANPLLHQFWLERIKDEGLFTKVRPSTVHTIGSIRGEALDIYTAYVAAELERADIRALLELSHAIRLKLSILWPLFEAIGVGPRHKRVPERARFIKREAPIDVIGTMAETSTIIALAAITTFAAFVPLVFALTYQDHSSGTWTDMDFWFLIQNSAMQLLGIFIAMYPISKRKGSRGVAWYWAVFFTTLGSICSLGSIFMYFSVPKFWSGFASFAGTASQVSMSVQLVVLAMSPAARPKQD